MKKVFTQQVIATVVLIITPLLITSVCGATLSDFLLKTRSDSWVWANNAGGSSSDHGYGVATDENSNIYLIGNFEGTATFGTTTLVSQGSSDIFVAKLDATGGWQWVIRAGGANDDSGYGIAFDGSIYLTGIFRDSATFGATTLVSQGSSDIFVAKLDATGGWQWAVRGGGTSYDYTDNIAVDSNGGITFTGIFQNSASFGATTLTSQGGNDLFVAHLNASGGWEWAVQGGGTGNDWGYNLAVDDNQDITITGSYQGTATFGTSMLISQGGSDIVVARLNMSGGWLWAVAAGGLSNDCAYGVTVDDTMNPTITGSFQQSVTFNTTTLVSQGGDDVYVAGLDANGTWQWGISAGGLYSDYGYDVTVDENNTIWVTGDFEVTAMFENTTIHSLGGSDIFVASVTSNHTWRSVDSAGGVSNDYVYGLAVDGNGNLCITGDFEGTAMFGSIALVSTGEADVFIAQYGKRPPIAAFIWTPDNPCSNQQITFNASASYAPNGTITLYEWDWDADGTYDESHTISSATHVWTHAGNYPVTLRVTDNNGMTDTTSHTVAVSGANQPPDAPTITGPSKGTVGVATAYNFTSTDPEDQLVHYYIDWGDGTNSGWIGPYQSGNITIASHTWTKRGTYSINAKAKDTLGNESGWGILSIKMPCSYVLPLIHFWETFFERFPNTFPIFRHIIGY
jgi:hypothetical protein